MRFTTGFLRSIVLYPPSGTHYWVLGVQLLKPIYSSTHTSIVVKPSLNENGVDSKWIWGLWSTSTAPHNPEEGVVQ